MTHLTPPPRPMYTPDGQKIKKSHSQKRRESGKGYPMALSFGGGGPTEPVLCINAAVPSAPVVDRGIR